MNHSAVVSRVHAPARPPDQASILAWTTSFGRLNEVTGHFRV